MDILAAIETSHIIISVISFLCGFSVALLVIKNQLSLAKKVSLIMFVTWVLLIILGLVLDFSVPWMFDFMGFGATGSLIGLNVEKFAADFIKRK